ncbi:MAG: trehalose-phosphatase [Planctomycetota bacterium]
MNASAIPVDLDRRLADLARTPVLLVASDYDGTLSPIVENPEDARPDREAMVALRSLSELPNTHASMISGRALSDLARLSGAPDTVHLVGSHGSEFDLDFAFSLSHEQSELRHRLLRELTEIADRHPGTHVETKPASVALHYRNAETAVGRAAYEAASTGPAAWEGVHTKLGKMVIELTVVSTNKGDALGVMRRRVGASAVLFIGDDVTDEDAFKMLTGPDAGVKVGEGESNARFRVGTTRDVSRVLARLAELRQAWLAGSDAVPIETHAMLSDLRTIALVTPEARITWMCVPRIDSPSLFAELLGGPAAGRFSIRSLDEPSPLGQSYLGDSFILRTAWTKLTVTDYLDLSGNRGIQRSGRTDLIRVIEGAGRVRVAFAPRLDFGRQPTRMHVLDDGLAIEDTMDPIVLRAPDVRWQLIDEGPHQTAIAEFDLSQFGGRVVLELRYGSGSLEPSVNEEPKRRSLTDKVWAPWVSRLGLPEGLAPELAESVRRSALVLRALSHGPTGAIAAAATTSLPESIGGVRNWDYRYCWPRDAAMSGSALVRLGCNDEAIRLLDWILGVVDTLPSSDRVSPIYTVVGHELPAEAEITELAGYAGSRPVRVGNAASRQVQLDVFGPIVELVWLLAERGAPLSGEHFRLVEAMVRAVEARWEEPDHGIWEIRGPRRHHVHSKVMCWQTAQLGSLVSIKLRGKRNPDWEALRDRIAVDVLERGWNEDLGTFTTAYNHSDLDAAVLAIGLSGLLSEDDPRWLKTVEAVERELRVGPTVYRYLMDDGLPGKEGGFNICTSWLIESYVTSGRIDEARALLDDYVKLAGPTGLMAEEFCPEQGIALGNHPQAYSHLGLINAALRIAEAGG